MALAPLALTVDRESSEHGCLPRQTVHRPNRTAVSCGTSPAQPDLVRSLPAFACCLAALAVSRPALCAQAPPPRLEPGARVRLDVSSLGRITGTLVAWEPDTLVVREDGQAEGLRLHRRKTWLEMRLQHVAHTECRCIQPDSEYGMCPKTLESCLRGVGCFGCSKAEAERRLHDEQREHYGAHPVK